AIPAENAFTGSGAAEIWAYGLRNPHRLTFDAETGRMLISDIGEANVEEINIGQAGANYGWSIREGTFAQPDDAITRAGGGSFDRKAHRSYVSPLPNTDLSSTTYPAIQYDHNESLQGSRGNAISDAHIYRGGLALLQGKLIFGDFPDGRLFTAGAAGLVNGSPGQIDEIGMYVDEDGDGLDDLVLDLRATVDVAGSRADIRIGVDADGELYLTNKKNGTIYRVVDAVATDLGEPPTLPPYVPPIDFLTTGYINVLDYAGVDRTGLTVSTQGIQQAVDDAIAQGRVVVFPPGTYLVDDTIRCMQPASDPQTNSDHDVGCTLIGDTSGARPLIKLADNSPLFGDPSIPQATVSGGVVTERPTVRPVIHFWRQQRMEDGGSTDPELENGANSYNNVVRNIDIDLGHANPGAIGIRLLGAEGSAIQEVKVLARNGFAGLYSFPSNGGLPTNIEIVGGRYGIYAPTVRGGAHTIAGLRMSGQTDQPIVYTDRFPLTIVGFEIVHDDGPVITPLSSGSDSSGHLALIDGSIEITGGSGPAIENTDRAVYMQNVYVKGSATIVSNLTDGDTLQGVAPAGWTHVVEYDYLSGASYIDTLVNGAPVIGEIETSVAVEAPPTDLVGRHVYPAGLCSFHDPAMVDVRDFGATGDGVTDDTIALQTAIDAGDAVLLPKGEYLVSGTLNLGSNTRLCGVATPLSAIVADPNWTEATPAPLLRTPDDAAANVVLDSFDIRTWDTANRIFHIDWRAGRNSIIKNITGTADGPYPGSFDVPLVRMRITGNGGGRVYGYVQEIGRDCMDPGCRLLLIQGTREPLDFYQFHSQYLRVGGGPLTELSDAQNVRFFGHKSETIIPGGEQQHDSRFGTPWPILMTIEDSSNIELFGEEGPSQAEPGRGLFEIRNSTNVTLINVGRRGSNNAYYDEQTWFFVKEEFGGAIYSVDATGVLGLFRRD
ncbi:MAG: glycosyl hydrolase family 28-related protein, partial [Gammaproteobacteria bacterium]